MKKILYSQNGFSGIEIAVAIVILTIFVSLISTIFTNIYLTFSDSQRNAVATSYATKLAEMIDKMYYADVEESNLNQKIQDMNIPSGYTLTAKVEKYTKDESTKDLVKTITITVGYKVGKNTKTVQIEKIKAKEVLITPNKPKLSDGMVPVKYVAIDEASGQGYWQITTEDDTTWYNYDNKRWANIMLQDGLTVEGNIEVTDENRKSLAGKKVTTLGSMFVWIPRYAYKIPDENLHTSTAGEIDIVFLYSTSDNYIDEKGDMQPISSRAGYKIHPSFQNGETKKDEANGITGYENGEWDAELTGYWVAKFEASSTDNTASYGGGNTTDLDVKVLPNVPSWRYITVSNSFDVCKKMGNSGNIYKLSNDTDSHLMKNSEWGACAYLAQSKYGKNGQVWNNPYWDSETSTVLTGKAATTAGVNANNTTACDNYNEGNGLEASTTGNVYGIYDMAGGSWERTAAYVDNSTASSSSNMTSLYNAEAKYKDVYTPAESDTGSDSWNETLGQANYEENSDKYGDAVYETSKQGNTNASWQKDYSKFPAGTASSVSRGGVCIWGTNAGVFCFSVNRGNSDMYFSFRPVIAI